MSSTTTYDYSQGSAFVHEGHLYYSPNSKRPVVIPPPISGGFDSPFNLRHLNANNHRQPIWWSETWGWISFTPLSPTFLSYPFEPLSWLPKIVAVQVSAGRSSSGAQSDETRYALAYNESHLWMEKEKQLAEAARTLRVAHGICGTPPPLPSTFGYHRHHKSKAIAHKMVSLAQSWFGIWMGYLSYIIQQTMASPYQQPDPNSPPAPYWYQYLLKDGKFSLPYLDGLVSSPVCQFAESVPRTGVVIPFATVDKSRPAIELFVNCHIPVFFPWTSTAEDAIRRDARLAHLRPPVELIQDALTFLTKSPNNAPVAALIMKQYCRLATDILDPESARILRLQYASSAVVDFVTEHFLKQYDSMSQYKSKSEADQALRHAMYAHHVDNFQKAAAASTLPQQGMIERDGQQNLYSDWKDFFRRRLARMPEVLKGATSKDREVFANRKRQPPRVETQMFTWEQVLTSGGLLLWSRKKVDRRNFEDVLDDNSAFVYNEVFNEWDIFPDFVWDKDSPDDGVPSVLPALPVEGRAVAYGSDSSDDEGDSDEGSFDMYGQVASSRRSTSPMLSDSSPRRQPAAHVPAPAQSSSNERSASPMPREPSPHHQGQSDDRPAVASPDTQHNQVLDNEDISSSTPLLEALRYNYGYTRSIYALPSATPELNWKGVGKSLGYMSAPPLDNEDIAIKHFVSIMTTTESLPADMNDLAYDNFESLAQVFDFRNIVRPQKDVFVFVELSLRDPPCGWLLSVRSPQAALYVVRYISLNPDHTALTVAHRLVKYGIPFNTLHFCPTSSVLPPRPILIPRYQLVSHVFTIADYQSAILTCKARLQGPAGRAALLHGGIVGHIARHFLSLDAVLDGPSATALETTRSLRIDSESTHHQYRDDVLTDEDIYYICGTYTMDTDPSGAGRQQAFLLYFPRPNEWDYKNGFSWLEWTNASEDFFQRILSRNNSGCAPQNPRKWRDDLRGFGSSRRLLDRNAAQSTSFIDRQCPVRSRY